MLHSQAVHLAREFIAEFFEQVLPQQLLLKRLEHARFHFVAATGQQVVAPALISSAEAREPVAPRHDESGAAHTTLREAREQVLWTARPSEVPGRVHRVPRLLLAGLRGHPELVG